MNYYNEFDPNAAAWLRELIKAGLIPPGDVDERSITEVKAHELSKYTQCHFFAGIGGWSLALRIAGWPDNEPVWTGSCPCQPISGSGPMLGERDGRHLWPEFFRLIVQCCPGCVFGEQVSSGHGYEWADGVGLDLERENYSFAAVDIPARAFGADHERYRLWWTANAPSERLQKSRLHRKDAFMHKAPEFREADGLIDAFRRRKLPFLCGRHDGVPIAVARGASRGFGNAIVPQVAAAFIQAAEEARVDSISGNRAVNEEIEL